jgi:hypothetical protein
MNLSWRGPQEDRHYKFFWILRGTSKSIPNDLPYARIMKVLSQFLQRISSDDALGRLLQYGHDSSDDFKSHDRLF